MKILRKHYIAGIRLDELLFVLLFYLLAAFSYHFTLWLNAGNLDEGNWEKLFSLKDLFDGGLLSYFVKLVLTIPVWWLIFRVLKSASLWFKLSVHLVTLPLFCFGFQYIYYTICEWLGFWHLQGWGSVWDIYIPALFYLLQFGIFHAYQYYRQNQRKLKEEAMLREAALKSELSALKAQLNPHFLYNVFNTINATIPPHLESSRQLIAELSDLFRYQLKASQTDWVTLEEELTFIKSYLELEKARFKERLSIQITIDPTLYQRKIPPMILQPLVENAIKHGISPSIEGGVVTIQAEEQEGKIHFSVSDTGVGFTKEKAALFGKGVGLTNTKLRLEKIYASSLKLIDNHPSGLTVQFAI